MAKKRAKPRKRTVAAKPAVAGASKNLFDSERRFRLLVEGVTDYAIYMLDPTGIVTNWNAGAKRIKGYSADEIIGQHFGKFYPPEERVLGMPARSLEIARREGKFEAEGWRLRKDGTRFFASVVIDPIYEAGTLIGFAKITRDITERQSSQQALQDAQQQFKLLVSGVTDYALYLLDPEGRVSSWNAGGQRIKGYAPEEIIGQHFSRFYTPADQDAGRPARALSIARTQGRYEEEGLRVRKDGSFFWASVIIDPIRDEHGRLIGYAKITRDITERRQAQNSLLKVQKQLAESQKMDALGQLTGGVAHDFNNLLMIVSGHIQTLKKFAARDSKAAIAAQAIEHAAQRGATLTRQLLSFSRRQRVNPETIDLPEKIQAIREVLNSGLGGNVGLAIDAAVGTWPVVVDVGELEVALINLVLNARDAMPDGGIVTIAAKNASLGEDESVPPGDYVAIAVQDTGVGIPADIINSVFDPFFTTKEVGKGTGLGLSQVYGFAHQAGGTVKIESELGKGTTLTILLPRGFDASVQDQERSDDRRKHAGTVLLVEDNPDVASASTGLLEQLGYSVRWALNTDTALKELEQNGIDLVFSDIVMPGRLDGLGLARIIKQMRPDLPILLTTGYSDALRNARSDFKVLQKPYEMHELSRALSELTRD
jgi:PAS domain S-box-containing protein